MTSEHVPLPVTAWLDWDGRLLSADAPLLRLQADAGGDPRGVLALPALAALVRLARRLRVPLSRAVELARQDADISLWVELRPEGDGFHLSIVDWQERKPRGGAGAGLQSLGAAVRPSWLWHVDDHMRFLHVTADGHQFGHDLPAVGTAFTGYFVLDHGGPGEDHMPMIEALGRQAAFYGQAAHLRGDPDVRYVISGTALFDAKGDFAGYGGSAEPVDSAPRSRADHRPPWQEHPAYRPPPSHDGPTMTQGAPQAASPASAAAEGLFGPAFGRRLDRALRQPLDRIIANAGTISDRIKGPLRQDYANYARDISSAGRHLLALVDDLADLQAIEGTGFHPASEEVDLAELARRAAGLLSIRAEARNVRVQAPAAGEQLLARAEYRRVLQILVNLIGNAVRHSPPESTIWVRLDEDHGRAQVIVADQGSGIDPVDHGRVFERFERLGNTDGDGSGLGLYISRKLAEAMHGDIKLESALGRGARFILDLPAWEGRQMEPRAG